MSETIGTTTEALYKALLNSSTLHDLHRLQYRCEKHRCLLLDAVDAGPLGIVLHQIRFKYSTSENERRSNAAGRAANTFDGAGHWKPRTYFIAESALAHPEDQPVPRLGIQCDHVGVLPGGSGLAILAPDFWTDWNARHAEVIIRSDGSRYAR